MCQRLTCETCTEGENNGIKCPSSNCPCWKCCFCGVCQNYFCRRCKDLETCTECKDTVCENCRYLNTGDDTVCHLCASSLEDAYEEYDHAYDDVDEIEEVERFAMLRFDANGNDVLVLLDTESDNEE